MALNLPRKQKIDDILRGTQFRAVQRSDGGTDFFQGNNKVNVNNVVQGTGINKGNIVQSLASNGDRYSQNYLRANPQITSPIATIPKVNTTPTMSEFSGLSNEDTQIAQRLKSQGKNYQQFVDAARKSNQLQSKSDYENSPLGIVANTIGQTGRTIAGGLLGGTLDIGSRVLETGDRAITGVRQAVRNADPTISNETKQQLNVADDRRFKGYEKARQLFNDVSNTISGGGTGTKEETDREARNISQGKATPGEIFSAATKSVGVASPLLGKTGAQAVKNVSKETAKALQEAATSTSASPGFVQLPNGKTAKTALKDAARLGEAERKRADQFVESSIKPGARAQDFVSNNLTDDTAYFQGLDRQIAKNQGKAVRNLPADESLDAAIQAYRYAPSIQEQRYSDLGIRDFAKKLSNQRDYDTYRIYRTFNTAGERAAANRQRGESLEQAYARFTGGRDFATDQQAVANIDASGDKFKKLFQEEVGINQKILRDRGDNPNLTLSPDDAESIIQKYPNYTPLTREVNEDVQQFQRSGKIGSQQGKNVKSLKEGSTTKPIEDPLTALMANADELVKKGQANNVSNILVKNFGAKLRPLVTEADLIAKEKARVSLAELGRDAKEITSAIRNNRALSSKLAQEIRAAEQATGSSKVILKQDPTQVTLNIANMSDSQFRRLSNSLTRQSSEYDNLVGQLDLLRKRADDIKSERLGIMKSGDLDAFEKNQGKNVLRRVVNGREEVYEVTDARLAQNLANLSGHDLSQAAKVLGVPTRIFKFFTTGPGNIIGFAPIALTRDLLSTILFAKAPIRSVLDPRSWTDAFAAAAQRGELFENLQRRGISGTMVEGDRAAKLSTSEALRNQGAKRPKVYAKNPGQIGRDLENFEMGTERFSRARLASASYRQSLARYSKDPSLTPEMARDKAYWDAAREYREGMLNFGRGGKVTRELNSVVAYLNPAVQAGNKVRRTFRENPFGATLRTSIAGSLIAGAYAYSTMSESQKNIYDQLDPELKRDNIILVGPDAKVNPDTGQVTGIINIPLPQEYAVLSDAVKGMFEGASGDNYGNIALSALSSITGLATQSGNQLISQLLPTNLKPFVENATDFSFFTGDKLTPDYVKKTANGDKTQEFRNSTSGTAKELSKAFGGAFSPIEAENVIRGFTGGASKDILGTSDAILNKAGIVSDEDTTSSNAFDRLRKRYTEAYGKSDAVKFFDKLESTANSIKNQDDRAAFNLLHEKNSTPGILDSAEKAQIYLSRPDVVKKERELNEWNKQQGKPSNPLFELSDTELQKVLAYRSAKMLNAGKQTYDKNGNSLFTSLGLDEPWYDQFRTKETDFYSKVSKKSDDVDKDPTTFSGAAKPAPSSELQSKLDYYYTLKSGTGERSAFLRANPDVLQYWEDSDGFTNKERAAIGLKPLEDEESSSGYGKGRGGGGSKSDPTADAYKYAVSLRAGGSAPKSEKDRVKARKASKAAVSTNAKAKPKVSIKKSLV